MALRCPVVCTDVTGVRGILRDGDNALLVPAAEPASLADGLVRALCDDQLVEALRRRGLADFEERFTDRSGGDQDGGRCTAPWPTPATSRAGDEVVRSGMRPGRARLPLLRRVGAVDVCVHGFAG